MSEPQTFAAARFSTENLREHDRLAAWREFYSRMALWIDAEPSEPFDCALVSRTLPDLQLFSSKMSAVRITRMGTLTGGETDDLAFMINHAGAITASEPRRGTTLEAGEAVLMSGSDISAFRRHSTGASLSLRIPRAALSPIVANIDDSVMRKIPQNTGALWLLTNYASAVVDDEALASPEIRAAAVHHIHDLVALTLGATRQGTEIARLRGLPAARLKLAKTYILANSGRHDLSVGAVAAQLGVTPRNVQQLFERDGTTFSAYVLARRLACAHRMLAAARFTHLAIGAIAYEVGFGDLSYFNRSFRQRFGVTPRDVRNGQRN